MAVSSKEEIKNLKNNQLVFISGKVEEEKTFENLKYFVIRGIEIVCNSCPSSYYKNKNLSIIGIVSSYNNKKEIRALSILENQNK